MILDVAEIDRRLADTLEARHSRRPILREVAATRIDVLLDMRLAAVAAIGEQLA